MDMQQFADMVRDRVVTYYNHQLPLGLRYKEITRDDVILAPYGVPLEEVIKTDQLLGPYHIEHVITVYNARDHLFFDATYTYRTIAGPHHHDFIFNCTLKIGITNEHNIYDESGRLIKSHEGVVLGEE